MERHSHLCHDLKTERPGLSGGMPGIFRIVPLLFYLAIIYGIAVNGYKVYRFQQLRVAISEHEARAEAENLQKNQITQKQQQMLDEINRAEEMAAWLNGARPVQPVVLSICRSFGANSSISQLSLERNPEIPEHTAFLIKINGDANRQLEGTIAALNELNYFPYSSQQVQGENALDYQATLVWRSEDAAP